MTFKNYEQYDAIGLNELIRNKEVSAEEVLEAAITRCEEINPEVNAIVYKMYDEARDQLKQSDSNAPLYGVPFLLKDLSMCYKGVPTSQGSRLFKDVVSQYDSELVKRYKKAGLIIMGKTNTPEFGTNWVTEPELFGPCRNPHDTSRTPGGSSGGSAAAVAAGITPVAHASDGGGSIRAPASCCGLVGLKPTRARLPVGPDRGESCSGLSTQHALTKSVRDSALLLDLSMGAEIGDPYAAPRAPESYLQALQTPITKKLKIGVVSQAPGGYKVDEECITALNKAINICEDLDYKLEEVSLDADNDELKFAANIIWTSNIAANIDAFAKYIGRDIGEDDVEYSNLYMAKLGRHFTAAEYAAALSTLHQTGRKMGYMMQQYDLLLSPTLAKIPVKIGELCYKAEDGTVTDFYRDKGFAFSPFTQLFNITGQPAISLPLHTSQEGLPIGVQFAAGFGNELLLLQLANTILPS
jgi:amidase